ncbi:hypothetical protein L2E82_32647 [Cichorium intybus]|uniref:Uncharacterized protein n=1 Tax=Cichorium intybus TaxID=13427 RepID=A0ACB9BJ31_CICIN|nr:hypothetical protein L2E82_32647 [Cichorium intybus]
MKSLVLLMQVIQKVDQNQTLVAFPSSVTSVQPKWLPLLQFCKPIHTLDINSYRIRHQHHHNRQQYLLFRCYLFQFSEPLMDFGWYCWV